MKIFSLFVVLAAFCSKLPAATFDWEPVEGAVYYRVWIAPTNAPDDVMFLTNSPTTRAVAALPAGTWLISLDAVAETPFNGLTNSTASPRSEAVLVRQLPKPATTIKVRLTVQEASDPAGPFKDVTNTVLVATLPASGFYRGKMEIER